jgi:hypothetical protein
MATNDIVNEWKSNIHWGGGGGVGGFNFFYNINVCKDMKPCSLFYNVGASYPTHIGHNAH